MMMNWTPIKDAIAAAKQILLLPHIYADGDALGSCGALAMVLREQGKRVTIVVEEAVPGKLSFLSGKMGVNFTHFTALTEPLPKADLAIAVDVSDAARLGQRAVLFDNARVQARIDHHAVSKDFAAITVCNPTWAATAEGIYELAAAWGYAWTVPAATCIYTGLVTDTGCFAYSNVTEQTLRIAADMRRVAGDTSWIYQRVFENKTKSCIALTAMAYARTEYHGDGQIAYLKLTQADYDSVGATDEDSEGFSAMLRAIEGVHVSIFVRDGREPGQYRFSLRSDEACDVAQVAGKFGGGGHARAAGITYKPACGLTLDAFVAQLLACLKESLTA